MDPRIFGEDIMELHRIGGVLPRLRHSIRRRTVWMAASFVLLLLGAPRALAQTAADSTITINWTAPGDDGTTGRATSYDIRYRTSAISGTDTLSWWNAATQLTGEPLPGVAGSRDSMVVRGLQPVTTYYFMVRTGDEVPNWSGYSNVAVKSTSGDVTAPAAIANLSITSTTGNSLALRWTAPGDDGATGTASSYDVRYSTTPITSANFASATQATGEPAPTAAGTTQTFNLAGLNGSQIYYVAMKAIDDRGNISLISNVVNGTTLDVVPPAAVRDLSLRPSFDAPNEAESTAEIPPVERHDRA
jgi:hypothetical protein